MLVRRAPLILALSLLTSAATACAECAWVLWWAKAPANLVRILTGSPRAPAKKLARRA